MNHQGLLTLLTALPDNELFSPSTIVSFAVETSLLPKEAGVGQGLSKQRLRVSLTRLMHNQNFPNQGDGNITINGQAPFSGWFGKHWKKAANEVNPG